MIGKRHSDLSVWLRIRFVVTMAVVLSWLATAEVWAQPMPPGVAVTNQFSEVRQPPMPPVWQSPVDFFRKLLAADPAERERLIGGRSPEQRQVFVKSLAEYESLAPTERENRLAALDLRFFLTPLLPQPPSNRVARLSSMPASMRPLVEARLRVWDELPAESQMLLVQNERVMRLVVAGDRGPERELNLSALSSIQIKQMEADITRWREMPEGTREKIYGQFQKIFDATERQRQKALEPLNAAELQQMQRALENFRKLPKPQRDQCLAGFKKFAELSAEERRQFLLNAEEWRKLNPEDRRLWRQMVSLMPPLPPGFGGPPLPPRPPLPMIRPNVSLTSTNR